MTPRTKWFRSLLLRPPGEVVRGTFTGIALLLLVSLPLSCLLIQESIALFERRTWDAMAARAAKMHSQSPRESHAEGQPKVVIVHERYGAPVLALQPLAGVPMEANRECELLHRFRVRKQPDQPDTTMGPKKEPAAKPEEPAADAPPKAAYEPDLLILELCRARFGNAWHYVIEMGYQAAPGKWQRIGWWRNNGIAPSNELLRFENDPYLPFLLRKVSMPCTVESATAFISKDLRTKLKELNSAYQSDPLLSLTAREFEVGVAQEFNRILPEYTGSLASTWPVFMALTISGGLQAFMVLATMIALFALLCRAWILGVLDQRWLRRLKNLLPAHSPRKFFRYVALCEARVRRALGLTLPSLAGADLYWKKGATSAGCELGQQRMQQVVEENDSGSYLVGEMVKITVYLGLLGTLTYLVWALLTMRIDSHTGKMQSILSITANTMSSAFLTTCSSATLARLVEFVQVTLKAAEVRRAREAAAWLAEAHTQVRGTRKPKKRRREESTIHFNGKSLSIR